MKTITLGDFMKIEFNHELSLLECSGSITGDTRNHILITVCIYKPKVHYSGAEDLSVTITTEREIKEVGLTKGEWVKVRNLFKGRLLSSDISTNIKDIDPTRTECTLLCSGENYIVVVVGITKN